METDEPYAYLYNLTGKVNELRWNQIKAEIAERAEIESYGSANRIPFNTLYDAYCRDRDAAASDDYYTRLCDWVSSHAIVSANKS